MVMFDIVVVIDIILLFIEHRLLLFHLIIVLVCPPVSASDHVSVILFGVVDSTVTTARGTCKHIYLCTYM